MDTPYFLNRAVDLFREEMGSNLVGVYLHGSLAMGCFNPNKSDIDLLIIAQQKLSTDNNKRIAKKLLKLHESMPKERGIELSIILESYLKDFVYPTPFEFHYSDYHRKRYQTDENYICGGFEDPDLAAHIVVTYHRGIALYGKALREVFYPIDQHFYINSILSDVENASTDIVESPMYFTLNLCRVLYYLKEGVVSSKKEGGEWGVSKLPAEYRQHIQRCLHEYSGMADIPDHAESSIEILKSFADYMRSEIDKLSK
ncbi:aminoglycoside adenylyltransferase domain-containing protein [Paenibacillus sp. NPDC058071]|uniref:aminoglycoside adenylyltransferase domain-containing protein n=1 Tax=Paenibacillus sp. NPDC058071 TaxID=3346326 RepID=UPI0036DEFBDC